MLFLPELNLLEHLRHMSVKAGLSLLWPRCFCFCLWLVMWLQLAQYTCGRTWRDIDIFHNSTRDATTQAQRPGNPFEKDLYSLHPSSSNHPSTSNNVFVHDEEPTMVPTRDSSNGETRTRSPSATFTQPTPPKEEPKQDLVTSNPPSMEDTLPFYPENSDPPPPRPPRGYFNYDTSQDNDQSAMYGPGFPVMEYSKDNGLSVIYENNGWAAGGTFEFPQPPLYYWDEFGPGGFGPWRNTLTERQMRQNQCGNIGRQSPIDIRLTGVACVEHHQIRTKPGDFRLTGTSIQKQILPSKLRLLYPRRPCADSVNNPVCAEPDPPHADFPNGWGGFADLIHVDFKFPSEHRIYGKSFDGEIQSYHLHPGRGRLPVISVVIQAASDNDIDRGHNEYLQEAIDEFQYEYDTNLAHCSSAIVSSIHGNRQRRRLANESLYIDNVESFVNATFRELDDFRSYSPLSWDGSDFVAQRQRQRHGRRLSKIWYPHHESLMPSYYFFGYDGSLTEPPCTEIVSWFVIDTPLTISKRQLEQMKKILFTNVDRNTCKSTSVHHRNSVARPIQESGGRQVWRCTRENFIPDNERQN